MADDPELRRLLWFLLGGSRGGENRARIIRSLRAKPNNLNRLAGELDLQYKAVQHHMRILVSNSLVVTSGDKYGMQYSLNPWFEAHIEEFEQICEKLHFKGDAVSETKAS
ncbi:MAG: winged helix-turn-helix domain-containing protein [Thaumarchaeota archaeon]|nr:winged helix-turn-helix domain-containing protein [Nitrososphaerota archaeon]